MKRSPIVLFLVLLLFTSCSGTNQSPMPAENAPPVLLAEDKVFAEAIIEPAYWAEIQPANGGLVREILVKEGNEVNQGDLLLRFDTTDVDLAIQQAEAALHTAQAELVLLQAGAQPGELAIAQSTLNQAVVNVEELGVTLPAATEQARLDWVQAANVLRDAQSHYENVYWENRNREQRYRDGEGTLPDTMVDAEAQAWRAVENAEANMEQARLDYEQALQHEESALRVANTQVNVAQSSLEQLTSGIRSEELAVAESQVIQAQIALEAAQATLAHSEIRAPFSGTVVNIHTLVNNAVTPGQAVLTLATIDQLQARTVNLTEMDVVRVALGQAVTVTIDALPDLPLRGQVVYIGLQPVDYEGQATYPVTIDLDEPAAGLRWGMRATVEIQTDHAD